jgi:2-polyprenyl-3-methyl-5-hydroxy-6-metoxy-1,4-benzoquinol methylase
MAEVGAFYDALAGWYHLVYQDWEASIGRQGRALSPLLASEWGSEARRVLDAAVGIGTQALGLAARGFPVMGSDLSLAAVQRAGRGARRRGLRLGCLVADMRALAVRSATFDIVLACDNALPHLLSENDIRCAFEECFRCIRPRGGRVISMRGYGVPPSPGTVETQSE